MKSRRRSPSTHARLSAFGTILSAISAQLEAPRKYAMDIARLRNMELQAQERTARVARINAREEARLRNLWLQAQEREARLQILNDKVVILDLQIEEKKRKMGIGEYDFHPNP